MEIWNGSEKFAKLYHCKNGWANYNNWSTVSVQGLHIFSSSLFKRFLSYRQLRQMPPDTSPSLRKFSDKKLTLTAGWGSSSDMNRVIYWKVSRITDIIHSQVKIGFQFFIYIWFLFTLTFTITSTIHNYDKNLEKKELVVPGQFFTIICLKSSLKFSQVSQATGLNDPHWVAHCSRVSHLKYQFILHSLLEGQQELSWAAGGCFSEWIKADVGRGFAWNNYSHQNLCTHVDILIIQ